MHMDTGRQQKVAMRMTVRSVLMGLLRPWPFSASATGSGVGT